MKRMALFFLIFIHIILPSFAKAGKDIKDYESKTGILYNYKETLYKFTNCEFSVKLKDDYKSLKIHYQSKSNSKDLSLKCNSYVEHLTIICVTETLYWFACESLGFEQYFIWNKLSDNLYEPFFDMKESVEISKIDYENQILFGDSWNSDKGIMPNQIVTLYLFSTEKQKHFKIAEKKGAVFTVKLLEDCKIEYEDQNGNLVIFDYSEWIPRNSGSSTVFSGSLYLGKQFIHTDEYSTVNITENSIKIDDKVESGKLYHESKFDIFRSTSINYIILNCTVLDTYFVYLVKTSPTKKYRYANWEITYGKTLKVGAYNRAKLVPFNVLQADSYITEKDKSGNEIKYVPEKNDLFFVGSNPWAVKAENKKIIYVDTKRWRHPDEKYLPISEIVFVNGFVNPDKEYLYEQNSRAKRIRISYNKTTFETELKDIGNFQVIHLPASINLNEKNNIKVEVLDYYPGTKYSDVVISGMYYMDATIN